ncbi:hypothetical protein AAMO2058_000737800 [Amorphochlora amoebiformis]
MDSRVFSKKVINKGRGDAPTKGSLAFFLVKGYYFETKTVTHPSPKLDQKHGHLFFDADAMMARPMELPLGHHSTVQGLDAALMTMKEGEEASVTVPSQFGYPRGSPQGFHGMGKPIPPNCHLLFQVSVLKVWNKATVGRHKRMCSVLAQPSEQVAYVTNLKSQGNEYFKAKQYYQAILTYLKGCDVLESVNSALRRSSSTKGGPATLNMSMLKTLFSALLLNTTNALIRLDKHEPATIFAYRVVQAEPTNGKAHYRLADACSALDRYVEAEKHYGQSIRHCRSKALREEAKKGLRRVKEARAAQEMQRQTELKEIAKSTLHKVGPEKPQPTGTQTRSTIRTRSKHTPLPESKPVLDAEISRNDKQVMLDLDRIPKIQILPGLYKRVLRFSNAAGRRISRFNPVQVAVHMVVHALSKGTPPRLLLSTRQKNSQKNSEPPPVMLRLRSGETIVGLEETLLTMAETELCLVTIQPPYTLTPGVITARAPMNELRNAPVKLLGVEIPMDTNLQVELELMLINFKHEVMGLHCLSESASGDYHKALDAKEAGNNFFAAKIWRLARHCYLRGLRHIDTIKKTDFKEVKVDSKTCCVLKANCLMNVAATYAKESAHQAVIYYCNLAEELGPPPPAIAKMYTRRARANEALGKLKVALKDLKIASKQVVKSKALIDRSIRRLQGKIDKVREAEKRKYGGFLDRKAPGISKGFLNPQAAQEKEKGDATAPVSLYIDKPSVGRKTCELCNKTMPCKQWVRHVLKYHSGKNTGDYESSTDEENYPEEMHFPPLSDGTQVTY